MTDSAARVARLERTVIDDRRAVIRSVEGLRTRARSFLSRADVQIGLFAAGMLAGASDRNLMRGVVWLAGVARWALTGLAAADVSFCRRFDETSYRV